ncbi:putative rRNA methylase [Lentisphaera araneosa HTCC2155]|jgi:RNA methyltransferase, TrmH family|uniref:Putative rRNA methylase n=1 Tax=Lentisphaera araneosa HTCC2155 TaxID=313628 RepID=A6DFE8_9BACT|nr:RNA methyltransferase [Lentisphaera araneosa]EDM29528.1 putative rRNA methylase [Lentisphaera araneosa HTCC2155]
MLNLIKVENFELDSLQIYRHLRDNAVTADNSFIADSPKVVNLLIDSGIRVKSILATEDYYAEEQSRLEALQKVDFYVADKTMMKKVTGYNIHHGVMMHAFRPEEYKINQLDEQIIMLAELSKNDNVGTIARSAAALGVKSYLVPRQGPHPYGRRALRVSMGYISRLKVSVYDDLLNTISELQSLGYQVIAAEASQHAIDLSTLEVPNKWVLLMGHEGLGLSQKVQEACDCVVKIEMDEDIKSFNVGVAAAILMYQMAIKTKA